MRWLMGADAHGTGRTEEDLKWSMAVYEDAYELAEEYGAKAVCWLGDFLHFKYGFEMRLLLEIEELIVEYKRRGIETYGIPGNHDKPWEEEADKVALRLLSGQWYCDAQCIEIEGTLYGFLPWFPAAQFAEESKKLARTAMDHSGLKFLFSHTPLQEGFVSPSNYQIETQIRVADLYPDAWDKVFLGDLHAHQWVTPKVVYLGAPRPRTWGDHENRGYWLLDVGTNGIFTFKCVGTKTKFPEYHKLSFGPFTKPVIPDWDPKNHYKVECSETYVAEVGYKYPGVIVEPINKKYTIPINAKFREVDLLNPYATFKTWLDLSGLDLETYYDIGAEVIGECLPQSL